MNNRGSRSFGDSIDELNPFDPIHLMPMTMTMTMMRGG